MRGKASSHFQHSIGRLHMESLSSGSVLHSEPTHLVILGLCGSPQAGPELSPHVGGTWWPGHVLGSQEHSDGAQLLSEVPLISLVLLALAWALPVKRDPPEQPRAGARESEPEPECGQ